MIKERMNFIKYNSKQGLSTIVVSLILILLSLVAIGVLWVVIKNIIDSASGDVGLSQFTISLDITNAYEQGGKIVAFVARKVGSGDLVKLRFIVSNGEESETYTVATTLSELASQKFSVPVSQLVSTEIETISVAPLFKSSGGEETLGNILDIYTITESIPEEEGTNGGCVPDCSGKECGSDGCEGICGLCTIDGETCTNGVCVPEGCTQESQGETCGTAVCGTKTNNCGEIVNCGTCPVGTCTNGVCVPEGCTQESQGETCGTAVCGTKTNNCGEIVNCGTCPIGQICNEEGVCDVIIPINTGIVEDLWPGDSGMYFGSSTLSTTESYVGYYATFPGSVETGCLIITLHKFPMEGYDKSHIGFAFETSLEVGDTYNIYNDVDGCSV